MRRSPGRHWKQSSFLSLTWHLSLKVRHDMICFKTTSLQHNLRQHLIRKPCKNNNNKVFVCVCVCVCFFQSKSKCLKIQRVTQLILISYAMSLCVNMGNDAWSHHLILAPTPPPPPTPTPLNLHTHMHTNKI